MLGGTISDSGGGLMSEPEFVFKLAKKDTFERKSKSQSRREYLQCTHMIKYSNPEYVKEFLK